MRAGLAILTAVCLLQETPADAAKAFEAALEAGRLDEAAALLEKLPPAEMEARRSRLDGARLARAVAAAFAAERPAAEARVQAAREAVAREARDEGERETRIEAALRDHTARTPLKVVLPGNVVLENAKVVRYADGRVKLAWPQGEVEYPLELLPEDARSAILAGLQAVSPRDHLDVGRLLLRAGDVERAGRCFAAAVRRDPALAPVVPDVGRIQAAARLFEGAFKASGSSLGIRWSFAREQEAGDFLPLQNARLAARAGTGLEIAGEPNALAVVRDIPFRDRVKLSALAREAADVAHILGLRFVRPDGREVLIYGALATSLKAFLVIRAEGGESQRLLEPTPGASGNRLTMDFNRGRFVFQVGEKTVWSGQEGGFVEVSALVGGVPIDRAKAQRATAVFKEVSLLGGVDPVWMAKKTAGYRDVLSGELQKEQRAALGAGAERSFALSIDAAAAPLQPQAAADCGPALEKVRAAMTTGTAADLAAARAAMEQVSTRHPGFAAAWYWRGRLESAAGQARTAAAHYERALALAPDFPEALCARAFQKGLEGRWAEARALTEKALALKADHGEAHLLQARLLHEEAAGARALEAARVARRLAPLDPGVQARAQMLANVVRGPAWTRPGSVETASYAVSGDIPAAKLRAYAEHLEAMRAVYAKVLGASPAPGRRAPVLVFNSPEGYHGYMEFTAGDPQEHTLGAYSPWYGQLALFEDVEPAETLRVLAHEGFHQFLHGVAYGVPIWFNEGMAEYVAATVVEKGQPSVSGLLADRLADLQAAIRYGWLPLGFDRIMQESRAEFYGKDAALKYAQAWSMIHFLAHGEGGTHRPLLEAYIARLRAGDDAREAFTAVFGSLNLRDLEAGWRKHHKLPENVAAPAPAVPPPAAAAPAPGGDLLAQLRAQGALGPGWRLEAGGLRSVPAPGIPLVLPGDPPEEYDYRVVVQQTVPGGTLRLGLAGFGRQFMLVVDEQDRGFLESVDGNRVAAQGGAGPRLLQGRGPVAIDVSVRRSGVKATVNGSAWVDWSGHFARLSLPTPYRTARPTSLFLLCEGAGEVVISELRVRAAAPPAAAPAPGPALSLKELKAMLAEKNEPARLRAIDALGAMRDREVRALLAEKLGSDTEAVRRHAAHAMAKQRHPTAAEALGKAMRAHARTPELVDEFIRALGDLDMCASIPQLVSAVDLNGGRHAPQALAELKRIGCAEAASGLSVILKAAEAEEKKPDYLSATQPNKLKDHALAGLAPVLRRFLQEITGMQPGARESWGQFVARGGHMRKTISIHYCGTAAATFEAPTGKTVKCPNVEGARDGHEDTFLKHRNE